MGHPIAHWHQRPPGRKSPAGRWNRWVGPSDLPTPPPVVDDQTDGAGLSDTLVLDRVQESTDNAGLTDALVLTRVQETTDSLGLTDSLTVTLTRTLSVDDTLGLTDSLTVQLIQNVTPTDNLGLTDSLTLDRVQAKTDTLGLTDSLVFTAGKFLTDDAGVTDSLVIELVVIPIVYTFSPPTYEVDIGSDARAPLPYFRLTTADTLVRVSGSFVSIRTPNPALLVGLTSGVDYFRGGYEYDISPETAAELTAAGYEVQSHEL